MKAKKYNKGGEIDPPKKNKLVNKAGKDAYNKTKKQGLRPGTVSYESNEIAASRAETQAQKNASEAYKNIMNFVGDRKYSKGGIMKAKKQYKEGGIFPPAIKKLKDRAAAKKAQKDAPIYDGIVGETTVTAKMPEGGPTLKREVNKPKGSGFRFMGDPSGKVGTAVKAVKSATKAAKYRTLGKIAKARKKDGAADLNKTLEVANAFDTRNAVAKLPRNKVTDKIYDTMTERLSKYQSPRGLTGRSDKQIKESYKKLAGEKNEKRAAFERLKKAMKK